jgi:hypothetical protein
MYKLWLIPYAHVYLDFSLPLFEVPLPNNTQAQSQFGILVEISQNVTIPFMITCNL